MDKKDKSVEVLKGLKITLHFASLNVRTKISIGRIQIPRIVSSLLLSGGILIMTILSIKFCIENSFNLSLIAAPVSCMFGCVQIGLMYLSFSQQNSLIVQSLDALQHLVNESNVTFFL